jgi:RNA polymerase sigma factor (sigma-70 family)
MSAVDVERHAGPDSRWRDLEGRDRYAACVVAFRDGDRDALGVLIAELTPLIWTVARSFGMDRTTTEDVVQTVWLAFIGHRDRLAEPKALAGWLITTARREAMRVQQRVDVELSSEMAAQIPAADPTPESEVLRAERDRELWTAFCRLSSHDQRVLRSVVVDERSYDDVAHELNMSSGSIGPMRNRALKRLGEHYHAVSARPAIAAAGGDATCIASRRG